MTSVNEICCHEKGRSKMAGATTPTKRSCWHILHRIYSYMAMSGNPDQLEQKTLTKKTIIDLIRLFHQSRSDHVLEQEQ